MNNKLVITALSLAMGLSLVSTNTFAAGQKDKVYEQQNAGVGIGFVIGAAFGGPLGAIAVSAVGNLVGESLGEKEEIVQLRDSLQDSQAQIAQVKQEQLRQQQLAQQQFEAMQLRYVDKQLQYEQKMASMYQQVEANKSLAVSLQFRTGSSDIEPVYQQQLIELAKTMQAMQGYGLDLSGYADRQGEEVYNQQLSQQRAAKVKAFLVSQGIDANRIATRAYGESQPLEQTQTLQSDFFDRRVLLKLAPKSQSVASAH
jgi:sortase system peptidoglycan-associated protein